MATAELRWAPHPFRAGFCITDDTDAAEFAPVRAVYDCLGSLGLPATKTVWAFPPEEPCRIPALPASITRGVTLADAAYREYCRKLASRGVEIALHGATAGNNRRALIERAYARLDADFPRAWTHVCHAKNADNIYWQHKVVARGPLRWALGLYAREHQCSGEDPASPYFWGDLCRERVRYIRLMRTRRFDTLAVNPSMPYFEREKPYVAGWFSATKRSFVEATSAEALAGLERDWGVCVLYQYMHRWAGRDGRVQPAFEQGARRLAAASRVWTDTATRVLDRLRHVQGVFAASRGTELFLVNTNDRAVEGVQVETAAALLASGDGACAEPGVVVVRRLEPGEVRRLAFATPVTATGRTALALAADGTGHADFGHGRFVLDVGARPRGAGGGAEPTAATWALHFAPGLEDLRPMSRASDAELTRLFAHQASIIGQEFLFKGRPVSTTRWLEADKVTLEDHARW